MKDNTGVFLLVGLGVSIILVVLTMTNYYHHKAIKYECGIYNNQTGAFQWQTKPK